MESTKFVQPDTTTRETGGATQEDKKMRKPPRRISSASKSGDGLRFYLAGGKPGREGEPVALGEEFSSEETVMIASFQKDLPFYRVETWKVRAEKKGRQIVLRKQS